MFEVLQKFLAIDASLPVYVKVSLYTNLYQTRTEIYFYAHLKGGLWTQRTKSNKETKIFEAPQKKTALSIFKRQKAILLCACKGRFVRPFKQNQTRKQIRIVM